MTAVPADAFTRRSDRLAAAALLEGRGSETTVKLYPGTGTSWALPPGGGTVDVDGAQPVRAVTFDRRYRPIQDVWLGAGRSGSLSLPPHAEQLVLVSPAGSSVQAAGWDLWSDLVQVNPQAFLGDGVVVRPQSPHLFRRGRGTRPTGVSLWKSVATQNRVASGDGSWPGWIDTWLPETTRAIDVAVERVDQDAPGPAETAVTVRLDAGDGWTELPWEREHTDGDHIHFVYALGAMEVTGPLRVRVQPAPSWLVAGVRLAAGAASPQASDGDAVTRVTLR